MIRLPCPNCKAIFASAAEQTETIYCRDCGFVIRDAPASSLDPASQWLYAKNRQKVGPVPLQELQRLLGSGQLLPSDMVLQAGTQKWGAASSVPGLLPPPAPSKVPAPTAGPEDDEWYVVQERKKFGPLSRPALQKLIGAGTIRPGDMLLKAGTQKWAAASAVPEFAANFTSVAPLPVATAPVKSVVAPPSVSADGWFYVKNGKKAGPVPVPEIRRLLVGGELAPSALVLRVGAQKWAALDTIPELAPPVAPAPAAVPVPIPAAPKSADRTSVLRDEAKATEPLPAAVASVQEMPKPPLLPIAIAPPPLPSTAIAPPPLPAVPPPLPLTPPPLPAATAPAPLAPKPLPEWLQEEWQAAEKKPEPLAEGAPAGWPAPEEMPEPLAEGAPAGWPAPEEMPEPLTEETPGRWPAAEDMPAPLAEETPVLMPTSPAPEVVIVGTGELGALLRKILGRTG